MSADPALASRRSLTLKFNIPISKTSEFWSALKQGRFVTTRCTSCGTVSFPPQSDCPKCMKGEATWTELGRDATVVTFTQVRMPPASFAECDPYVIAICELEGGLKLLAWLEGVDPEGVRLGMKVRLEGRTSPEGNPYYVFVPT